MFHTITWDGPFDWTRNNSLSVNVHIKSLIFQAQEIFIPFFLQLSKMSFTTPANLHSEKVNGDNKEDSFSIKAGLAQMLKVIN